MTPATIDVPPLKSCTFSVSFKPVSKSVPMAYFPRGGVGYGLWLCSLVLDSNKTFSVTPATIDVPPLKSCTFSVSFKPGSKSVPMAYFPRGGVGYGLWLCSLVLDSYKTFSVTPATIDVPPLKSCTFSVSFKPVSKSVPMAYFPRGGFGHVGGSGLLQILTRHFQ